MHVLSLTQATLKSVHSLDQEEVEQLRKRLKQQDAESDAAHELQHLKSILQVLRVSLTTQRLRSRTLIKAINQRGYSAKKVKKNETVHRSRHMQDVVAIRRYL